MALHLENNSLDGIDALYEDQSAVIPTACAATVDVTFTKDALYRNIDPGTQKQVSGVKDNLRHIIKRSAGVMSLLSRTIIKQASTGPLTYPQFLDHSGSQQEGAEHELVSLSEACFELQAGLWMEKVTKNKVSWKFFRLEGTESLVWKNGTKKLNFDSIKDIRPKDLGSNYRAQYGVPAENSQRWVSVIYESANKKKALHVIAKTEHDFNILVRVLYGLTRLRRQYMESILNHSSAKFASLQWQTTVFSKMPEEVNETTITFKDVCSLCERFNIYCSTKYLKNIYDMVDNEGKGEINFTCFQRFVQLLKKRDELSQIWNDICENDKLSFQSFYRFLIDIQDEQLTEEEALDIFNNYAARGYMNEDGLHRYLTAQPYLKKIEQDYTLPLNHYFISSSHNTYLIGKQLGETPSVEGYIQALQQGCRCVEVDIWDGEKGPVVCHGVLTASISLRSVVETIKKYAFVRSVLPLIISIEINCNRENQLIIAALLKDILGDLIYSGTELLSPLQLQRRILIKAKKTKKRDCGNSEITSTSTSSYDSEIEFRNGSSNRSNVHNSLTRIKRIGLQKRKIVVIDNILQIAAIHGINYRNISLPESKVANHCFSINEKKIESICKDPNQQLSVDKHNRKFLMRVYPHAFRYKSSNFNPIKFWAQGVQMVATNWQTNDIGQEINRAFFQPLMMLSENSAYCGYILKPPSLLSPVSKTRDILPLYKPVQMAHVELKIISAQFLPRPKDFKKEEILSPFVSVKFMTHDKYEILHMDNCHRDNTNNSNSITTDNTTNSGSLNPIWNSSIQLRIMKKPIDFAFIKFSVGANENGLMGANCMKLEYMKNGYRHIPLYNADGERFIFSTLFIYIKCV